MDSLRVTRHFLLVLALFSSLVAWQGAALADEGSEPSAQVTSAININSATAEDIAAALNGIGLAKAEAIVSYREQHGPFKTLADLQAVKGVGEKTVEKNASRITF